MNLEVLVRCYADSLAWNDEDQKLRSLERMLRTLSDDVANLAKETEMGRLGSSAKVANHDAIAEAMDAEAKQCD